MALGHNLLSKFLSLVKVVGIFGRLWVHKHISSKKYNLQGMCPQIFPRLDVSHWEQRSIHMVKPEAAYWKEDKGRKDGSFSCSITTSFFHDVAWGRDFILSIQWLLPIFQIIFLPMIFSVVCGHLTDHIICKPAHPSC